MKHGKNPTVAQKKILKSMRLNPDNWMVIKNLPDRMEIIHRHSMKTRTVPKE